MKFDLSLSHKIKTNNLKTRKMENQTTKKITLTTVKNFVKNNKQNLFINVKSDFDSMTDCIESKHEGFINATEDKTVSINSSYYEATLGINGVWLVRGSRDYFKQFENETLKGIEVSNCCGRFILAVKK